MDNSKYYNDSLAYDFNMFMPKEKKESAKIVKMPRAKKVKSKNTALIVSNRAKAIATIAFFLAVICANIFLRVRITEVNNQINEIKAEIVELKSEQTRLNVEFENRISYNNLELEAKELGMKKTDKSQVVYIRTNQNNSARTSKGIFSADAN